MTNQSMTLHAMRELRPGRRWQQLFEATWPAYRRWYLREGRSVRPSTADAERALGRFMPELAPVWQRLVTLTGDDPIAAAMLTQWNLPAFAPGCSQAAVLAGERALIRNYDYHPDLFEQVSMSTRYLYRRVIGTSDCLWGLLDGMNEDGLVISLAFGGEAGTGEGFGIPLVVRYLLEVASDVPEAFALVRRIPIGMSYNLTMSDAHGHAGTIHVAPGRSAELREHPIATNQRFDEPVGAAQEARFGSGARLTHLSGLVGMGADDLAEAFLRPPLHRTDFAGGFGTLYTADYRPDSGRVHYRWPGTTWTRGFDSSAAELRVDIEQEAA